jgi:hypothetical protein
MSFLPELAIARNPPTWWVAAKYSKGHLWGVDEVSSEGPGFPVDFANGLTMAISDASEVRKSFRGFYITHKEEGRLDPVSHFPFESTAFVLPGPEPVGERGHAQNDTTGDIDSTHGMPGAGRRRN